LLGFKYGSALLSDRVYMVRQAFVLLPFDEARVLVRTDAIVVKICYNCVDLSNKVEVLKVSPMHLWQVSIESEWMSVSYIEFLFQVKH
jgi:hypothetical protein